MANRRMFSRQIIQSDAFLALPCASQVLYVQLGMEADDEGVVNNTLTTMRKTGSKQKDLDTLINAKFLIKIDGLIVIKHWKINNYIQKDRRQESAYHDIIDTLEIDSNGAYKAPVDGGENVYNLDTKCIQSVRVVKDSIGKYSIDKGKPCTGRQLLEEFKPSIKTKMTDEFYVLIFDSLAAFIDSRIENKKKPSKDAVRLILKTLDDESNGNPKIAIAMIEKSIRRGWTDVFPLSEDERKRICPTKIKEMPLPEPPKNPLPPEEAKKKIEEAKRRIGEMFLKEQP